MELGKYEIQEELGQGGFGIVYKALDKTLNRTVAVKVLHPNLVNDPSFLGRFRQEAQLAAQMDHANLVTVHDFGEFEGRYFIVMNYLSGGSLKELIKKEGPLGKERSLKIFEQLCEGLGYAHKRKIVHRDLKPGNILFDGEGNARISDLGFAKLLQGNTSASLSTSGGIVGTPAYMAPEIWRGKPATSATDVYSLACVLVEMLTGEALFGGESTPEIMLKHFEALQLPESLPEKWKLVLEAALHKDQELRTANAANFLKQIKQAELKTYQPIKAEQKEKAANIKPEEKQKTALEAGGAALNNDNQEIKQILQRSLDSLPVETVFESEKELNRKSEKDKKEKAGALEILATVQSETKAADAIQNEVEKLKREANTVFGEVESRERKTAKEGNQASKTASNAQNWQSTSPSGQRTTEKHEAGAKESTKTEVEKSKLAVGIIIGLVSLAVIILAINIWIDTHTPKVVYSSPTATVALDKPATKEPTAAAQTATSKSEFGIGSTRTRQKDGMEQVYVPAGNFIMGSEAGDTDASDDEKPERTVYLDAYWIDKYEVTNGLYQKCVAEGKCDPPATIESYSQNSYYGNPSYDNYPVISVSWYDANKYCQWAGGGLPTEAQWEKAARGEDGRKYSWGNAEPDCSKANYVDGDSFENACVGDTSKVGSYDSGNSPYEAMDMAGNVWEWVNDWWADEYDKNATSNPQGPATGEYKVIRGGGWDSYDRYIRTAYRVSDNPNNRYYSLGFRCFSSP